MSTFRSPGCDGLVGDVSSRLAPILVLGPPRSGTTWVEQVLGVAAGARVLHEPDNETCRPFALRAKRALGRFPILAPGDVGPGEYSELWNGAFAGQGDRRTARWFAARAVLGTAGADVADVFDQSASAIPASLRLVCALASPPVVEAPERRVLIKSVHASLAAEWIAARWRPRVVVVLRHPLNIVASHLALGWGDSGLDRHPRLPRALARIPGVPRLAPGASSLARLAWQIGLFTAALDAAARRSPGWLVISHDDLCRNPERRFQTLCDELDLPWTAGAAAFLAASNRPGHGLQTRRVAAEQSLRWRRQLNAEQVEEIVDVLSGFPPRVFDGELVASTLRVAR